MTANHIDQLAEWWENAESGPVNAGDTVIYRNAGQWIVDVSIIPYDNPDDRDIRILARAPIPKPAWHDAVAVIAHTDDGHIRQVWERDGDTGYWCGTEGYIARTEKLRDATPLIEAKVTDEARDRVWEELVHHGLIDPQKHRPSQGWTADVVHAALGLETE